MKANFLFPNIFFISVCLCLSFRLSTSFSISSLTTPTTRSFTKKTTTTQLHGFFDNGIDLEKLDETHATKEELIDFAKDTGIVLSLSTLGPGYRVLARAAHNETLIVGYIEGFVRPGGEIIHLDKMEVYKKAIRRCREENPEFTNGASGFGVGLMIGCLCLRHGIESGCKIAEFLAIDDSDFQHKRLVRHYRRLGLNEVRYVGDEKLSDVPDRMVWGGVGTLMNAELSPLLQRWTPTFRQGND